MFGAFEAAPLPEMPPTGLFGDVISWSVDALGWSNDNVAGLLAKMRCVCIHKHTRTYIYIYIYIFIPYSSHISWQGVHPIFLDGMSSWRSRQTRIDSRGKFPEAYRHIYDCKCKISIANLVENAFDGIIFFMQDSLRGKATQESHSKASLSRIPYDGKRYTR